MTAATEGGLSSHDAAWIAGISYRQIDYWIRCGYIAPSSLASRGNGRDYQWRRFTVDHAARLCTIRRLIDTTRSTSGLMIQAAWQALERPGEWLVVEIDGPTYVVDSLDLGDTLAAVVVKLVRPESVPARVEALR